MGWSKTATSHAFFACRLFYSREIVTIWQPSTSCALNEVCNERASGSARLSSNLGDSSPLPLVSNWVIFAVFFVACGTALEVKPEPEAEIFPLLLIFLKKHFVGSHSFSPGYLWVKKPFFIFFLVKHKQRYLKRRVNFTVWLKRKGIPSRFIAYSRNHRACLFFFSFFVFFFFWLSYRSRRLTFSIFSPNVWRFVYIAVVVDTQSIAICRSRMLSACCPRRLTATKD